MADLEEAISLSREAVELRPPPHTSRSDLLNELAVSLLNRYRCTQSMSDLEEAISLYREALELRPSPHPKRSMSLSNLAISLHDRYQRTKAMADLEEAILLDREGLELRPSPHPERSHPLWNLSLFLEDMYAVTGVLSDLQESITLCEELLDSHFPVGHVKRVETLGRLARLLQKRFCATRQEEDLARIDALKDENDQSIVGSTSNTAVPSSSRIIGVARKHNRFISWYRRSVS
jgi:tetratricopeptide (TPR) repeat protein